MVALEHSIRETCKMLNFVNSLTCCNAFICSVLERNGFVLFYHRFKLSGARYRQDNGCSRNLFLRKKL